MMLIGLIAVFGAVVALKSDVATGRTTTVEMGGAGDTPHAHSTGPNAASTALAASFRAKDDSAPALPRRRLLPSLSQYSDPKSTAPRVRTPLASGGGSGKSADDGPSVSKQEVLDRVWTLELPRAGEPVGAAGETIRSMVCICAKCGSTSFYYTLYETAFGEKFKYKDPPWVQDLASPRWKGAANRTVVGGDADPLPHNSYAVIRDPRERIMSAFRSKITCEHGAGVNGPGRKRMVPRLLQLAGLVPVERYGTTLTENRGLCLNSTMYLRALHEVWTNGKEGELNIHFQPQTHQCFGRIPPGNWSVVTTIDAPGGRCKLATVVRGAGAPAPRNCSFAKTHVTAGRGAELSGEEELILEEITRGEYEVLGPYLAQRGKARVGTGT